MGKSRYFFFIACVGILFFLGTQIVSIGKDIKSLQPKARQLSQVSEEFMPKLAELKTEADTMDSQLKTLSRVAEELHTLP